MLTWRRKGRRGPCLSLLGALRPSITWSTLHLQDSHMTPFVAVVEPPSTSVGGPTSSSLPIANYSTSSSATSWGRVPVLQLRSNWPLHL
jgi:hypothetical protein